MKSSAKDHTEDTYYQIEDKVSENAGKISGKKELDAEGNAKKSDGKVQEKIGKVKGPREAGQHDQSPEGSACIKCLNIHVFHSSSTVGKDISLYRP